MILRSRKSKTSNIEKTSPGKEAYTEKLLILKTRADDLIANAENIFKKAQDHFQEELAADVQFLTYHAKSRITPDIEYQLTQVREEENLELLDTGSDSLDKALNYIEEKISKGEQELEELTTDLNSQISEEQ